MVAGIARLMTESRHDGHHVPWVLPPGISQSQLGGVFKLDWLHKYVQLPYMVCLCDYFHVSFWEGVWNYPDSFMHIYLLSTPVYIRGNFRQEKIFANIANACRW